MRIGVEWGGGEGGGVEASKYGTRRGGAENDGLFILHLWQKINAESYVVASERCDRSEKSEGARPSNFVAVHFKSKVIGTKKVHFHLNWKIKNPQSSKYGLKL